MSTPSSLKQQADSIFQKQDYKKAIELYTQAIKVDPSCEAAAALFSNRSLCHYKIENFQQALDDGVAASKIRPNWSRGFLRVATAAEALEQNVTAIKFYQLCLDLDRENNEVKQKYLSLFTKHVETLSATKSQKDLALLGIEYSLKNKEDEAILLYNAAIDLDPSAEESGEIYASRSCSFFNLKKYQESYDDASMATILRPAIPLAWMRKALSAASLDLWHESEEAFKKYFQLDPVGAKRDETAVKMREIVVGAIKNERTYQKQLMQQIESARHRFLKMPDGPQKQIELHDMAKKYTLTPNLAAIKMLVEVGMNLFTHPTSNLPGTLPIETAILIVMCDNHKKNTLAVAKEIFNFLLEEMLKQTAAATLERERIMPPSILGISCMWTNDKAPDPEVVRALLNTGKFDVNRGWNPDKRFGATKPPLHELVSNQMFLHVGLNEIPPRVISTIHVLLDHKETKVDQVIEDPSGNKHTPLIMCLHPEVSKILIRHGADVNVQLEYSKTKEKISALVAVFSATSNPHQLELLRVLIGAGAKLLADCHEGKASTQMRYLISGQDPDGRNPHLKTFSSEEILDLALHLNKNQGLQFKTLLRTPRAGGGVQQVIWPFLHIALYCAAPKRNIEKLVAIDPTAVNQLVRFMGEMDVSCIELLGTSSLDQGIANYSRSEYLAEILRILLRAGADLTMPREIVSPIPTMQLPPGFKLPLIHLFYTTINNAQTWQALAHVIKQEKGVEFYNKYDPEQSGF